MRHKTPESLAKVIATPSSGSLNPQTFLTLGTVYVINHHLAVEREVAKELLLRILGDENCRRSSNYQATSSNVLTLLAREFNTTQV